MVWKWDKTGKDGLPSWLLKLSPDGCFCWHQGKVWKSSKQCSQAFTGLQLQLLFFELLQGSEKPCQLLYIRFTLSSNEVITGIMWKIKTKQHTIKQISGKQPNHITSLLAQLSDDLSFQIWVCFKGFAYDPYMASHSKRSNIFSCNARLLYWRKILVMGSKCIHIEFIS